jgi:hypothetical protein
MPSYIHRRQLTPSQTRESLTEVRARLIEELRHRTGERVNHWNQLGEWCRQRPGRYISINWRANQESSSTGAVDEAVAEDIGIGVEGNVGSISSTTGSTNISLGLEDSVGGSSNSTTGTTSTGSDIRHIEPIILPAIVRRAPPTHHPTMSSSDLLSNKQALELIKGISLSPALQKSKDSILLAEDQCPEHLDSIFGKTDKATDFMNRKTERGSLEKTVYDKMVAAQDGLRSTMQLTPTTDNRWEKQVYRDWKHRVTNICLTPVQEVDEKGNSSHLVLLTTQDKTAAANANNYVPNGNKRNVEGLLMYHSLLVNDTWQAPDNLDARIDDLLAETKTLLVKKSYNPWDQYDANKARAQTAEIKSVIHLSLTRVYQ